MARGVCKRRMEYLLAIVSSSQTCIIHERGQLRILPVGPTKTLIHLYGKNCRALKVAGYKSTRLNF